MHFTDKKWVSVCKWKRIVILYVDGRFLQSLEKSAIVMYDFSSYG